MFKPIEEQISRKVCNDKAEQEQAENLPQRPRGAIGPQQEKTAQYDRTIRRQNPRNGHLVSRLFQQHHDHGCNEQKGGDDRQPVPALQQADRPIRSRS